MIEEFFMPLDRHFDSGFGAIADSFHEAAKLLDDAGPRRGFGLGQTQLPKFYLFRHCNELYFKSLLTILHRRFSDRFPSFDQKDFPAINLSDKKPKPLFQVHSIRALYLQLIAVLEQHANQIKSLHRTDWTQIPEEMEGLVNLIADADDASTMFRYPITMDPINDARKSAFKPITPEAAVAEASTRSDQQRPGVFVLAVQNSEDQITETYIHDEDLMQDVYGALTKLAAILEGAHFGMRHEFLVDS